MSYESAAVLPLGLSTAACGLFQKDFLALQYPSVPPKPTGKTLLVWGGSTSVGSNAIQLAVAAGYEVITTASPKNFDYAKKLGASRVFDYNSKTAVRDIIAAFKGKTSPGRWPSALVGAACLDIVHGCKGDKFVSMASFPLPLDKLPQRPGMNAQTLQLGARLFSVSGSMWLKARARRIRTNFIFGSSLDGQRGQPAHLRGFPARALAEGRYVAAPDPYIVGKGLGSIQAGFDMQMKGVSARKVVVSLISRARCFASRPAIPSKAELRAPPCR